MYDQVRSATCLWVTLVSIIFSGAAFANSESHSDFDAYVHEQLSTRSVAGIAIAVIEDGAITHETAAGVLSTSTGTALSSETVFQAASISKAVTAWGIMRLAQEGKIDLDAPVSNYLSRWTLPPSPFDRNEVTIRRILSHTGGLSLPSYVGFDPETALPGFEASLSGDTNGSGSLELVARPGDKFAYSGGGYTLLGLVIEEVTGLTFADYMKTNIFEPLAMGNSSYLPDETLFARTAQAHDFHLNPIPNYRLAAQAAGSLHTTAGDLARFAIANMSDNPVLTSETLREMHTPIIHTGLGNQMGLGFFIESDGQLIGHSGSNRGWKARVQFRPATGDGLVVLTNSESGEALVNDVFCHWNNAFQIGLLSASCASLREREHQLHQIGWIITVLLAVVILALLVRLIDGLARKKRSLAAPSIKEWQGWVFILMFTLSLAHGLFMNSSYGVWLVAGIPWGFSISDHTPAPIQNASDTMRVLYFVIAATLLTRRNEAQ